jgi:hypothetical protein
VAYLAFKTSVVVPPVIWCIAILVTMATAMDYLSEAKGETTIPTPPKPVAWGVVASRMLIALLYITAVVEFKQYLGPQFCLAAVGLPSIFCFNSILAVRSGGKSALAGYLPQYGIGIASCAVLGLVLSILPTGGLSIAVAVAAGWLTSLLMNRLVEIAPIKQ